MNKIYYPLNDNIGFVQLIQSVGNDTSIVNSARTKTQEYILEAYKRGYRVNNEGELFNPSKELKKFNIYGSQRYPTFSIHIDKQVLMKMLKSMI